LTLSCRVYDERLLRLRDSGAQTLNDLGDAAADGTSDSTAPDSTIPDSTALDSTAPDTTVADTTVADTPGVDTSTPDADSGLDAPDAPASCDPVLARGVACIEPFSGHGWDPNDPRPLAPLGLALTMDRVYVGDVGTGRVLSYPLGGMGAGTRVAGTGTLGVPLSGEAPARNQPLGAPAVLAVVAASGDLLVGDADARTIYRVSRDTLAPLSPFLTFQSNITGLALFESGTALELYISADNRVFRADLRASPTGATASPLAGLGCRTACTTRFNGDGMAADLTALNNPAGLDVDLTWVYFADRDNCRVRRFRREDGPRTVETYAGGACDFTGDPLGTAAPGAAVNATALRLGQVTDVKVGFDGTVFVLDATRCAVFEVAPSVGGAAPQAQLVAGSRRGCGQAPARNDITLERVGSLALSADRNQVYFTELRSQRVGRIADVRTHTYTVTWALSPGSSPIPGETPARFRVGRPSGLAVGPSSTPVWVAGLSEHRLYRVDPDGARIVLGDGTQGPTDSPTVLRASTLLPQAVLGLSLTSSGSLLLGIPERGVIASLEGDTLTRVAGRYGPRVASDAGVDVGPRDGSADVAPTEQFLPGAANPFAAGSATYFTDALGRLFRITATGSTSGVVELLAGAGVGSPTGQSPDGGTGVPALAAAFGSASSVVVDRTGQVFVADPARSVVWSVVMGTALRARVVAGMLDLRPPAAPTSDLPTFGPMVALGSPVALAYDGNQTVFIADVGLNRVRTLGTLTGSLETLAGQVIAPATGPLSTGDHGPASMAGLSRPVALAYTPGRLYVAEAGTGRVRVIRLPARP
jgi:hypothetical protein